MGRKNRNAYIKAALIGILAALLVVAGLLAVMLALKAKIQKNEKEGAQTESEIVTESQTESESVMESQTETEKRMETESETETETGTENKTEAQTEWETAAESKEEAETEALAGNGRIVAIDAGHQGPGQDMSGYEPIGPGSSEMKLRIVSGTEGRTTGLAEYDLDLRVSLLLEQELINRGYQVIMTRTTNDINIGNVERAQIANDAGADIMVRIHANGSDDTSVSGALTMAPSAANPYVGHLYGECYNLASCIVNAYCEATGLANDGILEVDNMTGINWCQMPVTIVEMGFMTNPGDDTYMADSQNQAVMAAGIADGIDQYFGR